MKEGTMPPPGSPLRPSPCRPRRGCSPAARGPAPSSCRLGARPGRGGAQPRSARRAAAWHRALEPRGKATGKGAGKGAARPGPARTVPHQPAPRGAVPAAAAGRGGTGGGAAPERSPSGDQRACERARLLGGFLSCLTCSV